MNGQRRGSPGFTFIEILVTVAIVAILAAVAIPSMSDALNKTRKSVCDANKEIVRRGLIMDLMLESTSTSAEKRRIADVRMADLGTEKVGTGYVGLCPCGGKFLVSFANALPATSLRESQMNQFDPGNMADKVYVACSEHDNTTWVKGARYEAGDLMCFDGFIFKCLASHTSGSRSNTRNPAVKSNKGSWEVVGYTDGMLSYNRTVRYEVGLEVIYNGHIYARTDYNLTGGQTPYSNSSSRYWILVSTKIDPIYDNPNPSLIPSPSLSPSPSPSSSP